MLDLRELFRKIGCLAVALWLAGCAPADDSQADRSFITDQPCAAPCWYSLVIDQSTKADVLRVLAGQSFVTPKSIKVRGTGWPDATDAEIITFDCSHPELENCGAATIAHDQLKTLSLAVSYKLDLQAAVDKLGLPERFSFSSTLNYECLVGFEWPARNIVLLGTGTSDACKGFLQGAKPSRTQTIVIIEYIAGEALNAPSGGCCTTVAWPGFNDN